MAESSIDWLKTTINDIEDVLRKQDTVRGKEQYLFMIDLDQSYLNISF